MQYYRWFFLWVLLFFSVHQALATGHPLTGHITMQNGLPSNVIYDIYEDSKGFIWFSTDQGISRYDGTSFRNYSIKEGLPDIEVFRIREDKEHRYWLVCYNRKACYLQYGKVYTSINDSLCRKIEAEGIQYDELFTDREGNDCLVGRKLAVLSNKPPYLHSGPELFMSWGRVRHFIKNGEDYLTTSSGVWNVKTGHFIKFPKGYAEASFYNGQTLFSSGWSNPDIGHVFEIWQLNDDHISLLKSYPSKGRIYQINAAANGLQLSTTAGMMIFDTLSQKIIPDTTFPEGIPVNAMLNDRENNRWLGTLNDGVYFIPVNSGRIINRNSGLQKNNILSITLNNEGHIIAGDDAGHVYHIKDKSIETYLLQTKQSNNRVLLVMDNGMGTILAGTDIGLYAVKKGNIHEVMAASSIKAGTISGHYAYAVGSAGLVIYDFLTQKFSCDMSGRITAVAVDKNKTLWTGKINGLYYFRDGKPVKYNQNSKLTNTLISAIAPLQDGGIIAGSSTLGLFILKDPHRPPIHLDMSSGLASNNCRKLFVSDNGYIWVCSNAGIDRIQQAANGSLTIKSIPLPYGIPGNQVNDLIEKNGKLYLATAQGILILNSRDTLPYNPPRLYIESVNGTALTGQPLRFPYNERNLQIAYTGLSYTGGTPLQYKYILTGGSKDTLYTHAQSIDFTALSPGSYDLLIWCRSPGSQWTAQPASLAFTILPPFWYHPVWIGIILLVTGTLIIFIFRSQVKKIKKRAEQESHQQQQLAQLEMNALRAQINPHFIFNALNAIQFYYSQNDDLTANQYMSSFAHFIRLTLTHSQAHWLPLSEEIAMLRTYMELEQIRFRHLFDVTIQVAADIEQEHTAIPAMLIQPYVENAVNHGLRHLKTRKGLLKVSFELRQDSLYCIVDDNGIGRKQAEAYKKVQHTSHGMKITEQRIQTMNRMFGIIIAVHITDKPDTPDGPGGTLVTLIIPLKLINHDINHTYS